MKIYLASESPRRHQLLTQAGIKHYVIPSFIDEKISADLSPDEMVITLSARKANALLSNITEPGIIIAADTIVFIDSQVLNKPADEAEAFTMLTTLQNRMHTVYTGVAMVNMVIDKTISFTEKTNVFFRPLSDEAILSYIASGEPMDKAGAYGIQEKGAALVTRIEGDFYTVMGLPVARVCMVLEEWGVRL